MTANEHFLRHFPNFNQSRYLWRYMDLRKLRLLLESSSIWFSRADRFDDTFEGAISDATRKVVTYGPDVTTEMIEEFNRIHLWWKQWTNISCWHLADGENALMWQAYAKDGAAIRTTFERLSAALPSIAFLSPIFYKDFSREIVPDGTQMRYFVKRHQFSSESEVRALIINAPADDSGLNDLTKSNPDAGLKVPVDLSTLLECVVTRPYASDADRAEVVELIKSYGHSIPVQTSELSGQPRWN